jgi:hypothetical protein
VGMLAQMRKGKLRGGQLGNSPSFVGRLGTGYIEPAVSDAANATRFKSCWVG